MPKIDSAILRANLLSLSEAEYGLLVTGNSYTYPFDPFPNYVVKAEAKPFTAYREWLRQVVARPSTPWYGFIGYDVKNQFESLESTNSQLIDFPEICLFNGNREWISIAQEGTNEGVSPLIAGLKNLRCHTSFKDYQLLFDKIKALIKEGEVYELNYCIAHSFDFQQVKATELFIALNELSPSPFSGFMKMGHQYILSASPERFLKIANGRIISQPIKGTAPRSQKIAEDEFAKMRLQTDEKELAENRMIVDLVRNDLTKAGVPGTTQVDELFGLYSFPQVHQLISTVSSEMKRETNLNDILAATFPMGSMTGAPKIAAMQIIEQVEDFKRGPYSGSMGCFSADDQMDCNVLIRSIFIDTITGNGFFCTGGAITWDSQAEEEYAECMLKAKAIYQVLQD